MRRLDLPLRTGDAIHMAIACRLTAELATFDRQMAASAEILGLAVRSAWKAEGRASRLDPPLRRDAGAEGALDQPHLVDEAGRREAEEGSVNIRRLGVKEQESARLDDPVTRIAAEALPPDLRRSAAA